jgi:hypothetical protein
MPNSTAANERNICADITPVHCPAMKFVNPAIYEQAKQRSYAIGCIFEKLRLHKGKVLLKNVKEQKNEHMA